MRKTLIPAAIAAAVIALPASAAAGPTASASGSCPDKSNFAGTQYVINIKTKKLSCGKATKVIKAHQKAGAGNRTAKGYKCSQKVQQKGVTSFYATVSCKKGSKRVSYGFQKSR